jgi:hypothetical protein
MPTSGKSFTSAFALLNTSALLDTYPPAIREATSSANSSKIRNITGLSLNVPCSSLIIITAYGISNTWNLLKKCSL